MKVVLDANVYVSGILNKQGNAKTILAQWEAGKFELLVSPDILTELDRVLRYPKIAQLHRWTDNEITEFIELLSGEATIIMPNNRLSVVADDESDNRYIECAVAGGATYLVTGDKKHLLPLQAYADVQIVTPAIFVALL